MNASAHGLKRGFFLRVSKVTEVRSNVRNTLLMIVLQPTTVTNVKLQRTRQLEMLILVKILKLIPVFPTAGRLAEKL